MGVSFFGHKFGGDKVDVSITSSYDRQEEVIFNFDKVETSELTEAEKGAIIEFSGDPKYFYKFNEDDTISFTFKLYIFYYREAAKLLNCVESLLDNKRVIQMSTKELTLGKSLIQDVLNKIEKIEKRLA